MVAFIDDHRDVYGVEPICEVLPIAPSTYFEAKAREADPTRPPWRARRDGMLSDEVRRVWKEISACTERARFGASSFAKASQEPDARWRSSGDLDYVPDRPRADRAGVVVRRTTVGDQPCRARLPQSLVRRGFDPSEPARSAPRRDVRITSGQTKKGSRDSSPRPFRNHRHAARCGVTPEGQVFRFTSPPEGCPQPSGGRALLALPLQALGVAGRAVRNVR